MAQFKDIKGSEKDNKNSGKPVAKDSKGSKESKGSWQGSK
jgi:hypothetical protein